MENHSQLYKKIKNGVSYYKVKRYHDSEEIIFSYADWNGKKGGATPMYIKKYVGSFEELNDFIENSPKSVQLTNYLLKSRATDGATNRTKGNVLTTDLVLVDFDQGTTFSEITDLFGGYKCLIRKSSSWSEEKEKYHVFLHLSHRINLSHDEYKIFYENLMTKLMITGIVDLNMAKGVQPFYEGKDRNGIYNNSEQAIRLDPRCCIEGSNQAKTTKNLYEDIDTKNRVFRYINTFIDDMLVSGERDNRINSFIFRFESESTNIPTASDMTEGLNWIYKAIADKSFESETRSKFERRINAKFNQNGTT